MKYTFNLPTPFQIFGEMRKQIILHRCGTHYWLECDALPLAFGKGLMSDKHVKLKTIGPALKPKSKPLYTYPDQGFVVKENHLYFNSQELLRVDVEKSPHAHHIKNLWGAAQSSVSKYRDKEMWSAHAQDVFSYHEGQDVHFVHHPFCTNCGEHEFLGRVDF